MKKNNPWSPCEPTSKDPWDLRKVAHLHRRAGFGASWAELQRDLAEGPAESIERLLHPLAEDEQFRRVADALKQATGALRDNYAAPRDSRPARVWWLYRMAYGGDPLGEKLTLFWHNHFATGLRGVYNLRLMLEQNELFRQHARGKFGELLRAVESDRAMLVWLDGGSNRKEQPNENFARELLELFTLGTGNYTEADVRAAARGLTGWQQGRDNILNKTNEFSYQEELADTSTKTLLGQTGPWRRDDILRIVLEQPAAAMHLCRRLYRWFVSESAAPSDEFIAPLAAELRATNYSIEHVVGIMLRSRHFFSPNAYRQRVKSPVEFCVGAIRQLEPPRTPNLLTLVAMSCERQGQILFDPPSVKGWEGGRAWLNSNGMLMRLNWIAELLGGNSKAALPAYDPEKWAKEHALELSKAIESFCELLLQDDVSAATISQARELANGAKEKLPQALQVLLQAPEYQLA
ncbi:MAG: DUF1800 domain-containing protein [Pirellulales bacterium]